MSASMPPIASAGIALIISASIPVIATGGIALIMSASIPCIASAGIAVMSPAVAPAKASAGIDCISAWVIVPGSIGPAVPVIIFYLHFLKNFNFYYKKQLVNSKSE